MVKTRDTAPLGAEVWHNGHRYRFDLKWDAGWVIVSYLDGKRTGKRLTASETGQEALVGALLALEG